MNLTGKRVFCLITGASRGLGRELAVAFTAACADQRASSIEILLHARLTSKAPLESVAQFLADQHRRTDSLHLVARTVYADLSSPTAAVDLLERELPASPPDIALLLNNAGICTPAPPDDADVINRSLTINAVAPGRLAARFASRYPPSATQTFIVLVSSKGALAPICGAAAYCASKAAAEMLHRAVAREVPHARVLLFAPGRMDTGMAGDPLVRAAFGTPVGLQLPDPNVAASVLMKLLQEDRFENGAHVDIADCLSSKVGGK